MTTFSNLPIVGDITRGENSVPQRPESEFVPILQAVLDDPTIRSFRWKQYTPYFNDGDPCTFRSYFSGVSLVGQVDGDDDDAQYDGWPSCDDETIALLGERDWRNGNTYSGPDEARYDRLDALARAIESGAFNEILLDKFGDHATVRVVPNDGFYVEFYEHD